MNLNRYHTGRGLMVVGGGVLAFGIFLLITKFVMLMAWSYAGAITVVGLVMFLVGRLLLRP